MSVDGWPPLYPVGLHLLHTFNLHLTITSWRILSAFSPMYTFTSPLSYTFFEIINRRQHFTSFSQHFVCTLSSCPFLPLLGHRKHHTGSNVPVGRCSINKFSPCFVPLRPSADDKCVEAKICTCHLVPSWVDRPQASGAATLYVEP